MVMFIGESASGPSHLLHLLLKQEVSPHDVVYVDSVRASPRYHHVDVAGLQNGLQVDVVIRANDSTARPYAGGHQAPSSSPSSSSSSSSSSALDLRPFTALVRLENQPLGEHLGCAVVVEAVRSNRLCEF